MTAKPDSMIVEPEFIASVGEEVASKGVGDSFGELWELEPALASYIGRNLTMISGKVTLSGAPTEFARSIHEDVLTVILTVIQAQRRGHYEMWKDTMEGEDRRPSPQSTDRGSEKNRKTKSRALKILVRNALEKASTEEKPPYDLYGRGHEPRVRLSVNAAANLRGIRLPRQRIGGFEMRYYYPARVFARAASDLKKILGWSPIKIESDIVELWIY